MSEPSPPLAAMVTLTAEAEVIPGPAPEPAADAQPDDAEEAQQ